MGYGGIPQSVKSIVLIPINGNSCKLVYHGVGFGLFFIAEISSETRRKRCNYHLNHQTFEGNKRVRFNIRCRYYPMHSNAQWCNGKHLKKCSPTFDSTTVSFHQLQTAWPLTKVILDGFHLGWLLVEEISVRCLLEPYIDAYILK